MGTVFRLNKTFSHTLTVIMFELTVFCDSKQEAVDFLIKINRSRICGKGVGLSLFPSDSLESQSCEFIEITLIGPYGVE